VSQAEDGSFERAATNPSATGASVSSTDVANEPKPTMSIRPTEGGAQTPRAIGGGRGPAIRVPWWWVFGLVGVDHFSTLAYFPSMAAAEAGPLAPVGAAVVALITLLVCLPLYRALVGHAADGRGGIGLLERRIPGWRGKFLVLILLGFVAADYVVTRSLSIADAAEHLLALDGFGPTLFAARDQVEPWCRWLPGGIGTPLAGFIRSPLALTLALTAAVLVISQLWTERPRLFLTVATFTVTAWLLMTLILTTTGLWHAFAEEPERVGRWWGSVRGELDGGGRASWPRIILEGVRVGLAAFPALALGLSGFELSLAAVTLIRSGEDSPGATRVRGARRLLAVVASLMAVMLVLTTLATSLLVPPEQLAIGGAARHRSLAWIAHGGMVPARPPSPAPLDSERSRGPALTRTLRFAPTGRVFGVSYDVVSVLILCLAGAGITITLRDFVPVYLLRFGMELEWANNLLLTYPITNLVILIVATVFRGSVDALQAAYATCVLALLAGSALALVVSRRLQQAPGWRRALAIAPARLALLFFLGMGVLTSVGSRAGIEIPLAFAVAILVSSMFSRWLRSTEPRGRTFTFADEESRRRWLALRSAGFQALVPHRPGRHPRSEKESAIRRLHRLGDRTPIVFIEAELGDPSDFEQTPVLSILDDGGSAVVRLTRCCSIPHTLAALALDLADGSEVPPEIHFGWSDETPIAANLGFLLFGEGNVPWMVHYLLRRSAPDPARRPRVIVG
jgi:hypothetical protein